MDRFCPFCIVITSFVALIVIFLTIAIAVTAGNDLHKNFDPVRAFGKKAVSLSKEIAKNSKLDSNR